MKNLSQHITESFVNEAKDVTSSLSKYVELDAEDKQLINSFNDLISSFTKISKPEWDKDENRVSWEINSKKQVLKNKLDVIFVTYNSDEKSFNIDTLNKATNDSFYNPRDAAEHLRKQMDTLGKL